MSNAMTVTADIDTQAQLIIEGEYGYGYVAMLLFDNGEHPGGPYIDYFEYDLGTFNTIDECREEAAGYIDSIEEGGL